jgi:hypothetical protein
MTGGAGADVFRFEYRDVDNSPYNIAGGGRDVVTDFVRGQDKLRITESSSRDSDTYQYSNGRTDWTSFDILKFSDLDTNEDGVLDATDEAIRIAEVELDNEAKDSLIIDLQRAGLFGSGAIDQIEPTSHRITLFGVTSLDASGLIRRRRISWRITLTSNPSPLASANTSLIVSWSSRFSSSSRSIFSISARKRSPDTPATSGIRQRSPRKVKGRPADRHAAGSAPP